MVRPVDVVGYPTPKNKDILLALIPKPLWTPIFFLLNLISLSKRVPEAIKTFGPFFLASGLLILIREYHKPLVGIKIPNSFLGTSAQALRPKLFQLLCGGEFCAMQRCKMIFTLSGLADKKTRSVRRRPTL
jgi:hypothetical protein